MKTLSKDTIKKLENIGGKYWSKDDKQRVYYSADILAAAVGMSRASKNGLRSCYVDCTTGEILITGKVASCSKKAILDMLCAVDDSIYQNYI